MIISPGFIDLHSHVDQDILAYPNTENCIMQGITTAIVGNCGMSMAPISSDRLDILKKFQEPFLVEVNESTNFHCQRTKLVQFSLSIAFNLTHTTI